MRLKYTILFFAVTFVFLQTASFVSAAGSTGTINTTFYKAKVCHDTTCTTPAPGLINFRPTNAPSPISISDGSGIDGYAWGEELGWINFNPATSGVNVVPSTGVLNGYAWSSTSGWINFNPANGGVTITTAGEFSGWAWASGAYGGWIKFNCADANACVKTDWVPISARSGGGGGGGGGGIVNPPLVYNPPNISQLPPGTRPPVQEVAEENKNLIDRIVNRISGIFKRPSGTTTQTFILDRSEINVPIVRVTQTLRLNTNSLMCKEPLYPCPYFTRYQQPGDNGGDVIRIQKFLNTLYKNNQVKVTGKYDATTEALVKKFQKDYSKSTLSVWGLIEPTGAWYQATRRVANELVGCYDPILQIDTPTINYQE